MPGLNGVKPNDLPEKPVVWSQWPLDPDGKVGRKTWWSLTHRYG